MKVNLHKVNYDGSENQNGHWYVWKEICDRCGKVIFDESVQHSERGKNDELDFCCECYRFLLDNDISYKEAKKMCAMAAKDITERDSMDI